jgi:hypothetical protein
LYSLCVGVLNGYWNRFWGNRVYSLLSNALFLFVYLFENKEPGNLEEKKLEIFPFEKELFLKPYKCFGTLSFFSLSIFWNPTNVLESHKCSKASAGDCYMTAFPTAKYSTYTSSICYTWIPELKPTQFFFHSEVQSICASEHATHNFV